MVANTRIVSSHINAFYRDYSEFVIFGLIAAMAALLVMVCVVSYLLTHRELPAFSAVTNDGKRLQLISYKEPSLVPGALLNWSSKAAILAYTFNFSNYNQAIELARPYFTSGGWKAYKIAVTNVVNRVRRGQLFVNAIVSAAPVITTQGDPYGRGYSWQVQLPFLVTYSTSDRSISERYYVLLTIVRVPTTVNPEGIGIEQFNMIKA